MKFYEEYRLAEILTMIFNPTSEIGRIIKYFATYSQVRHFDAWIRSDLFHIFQNYLIIDQLTITNILYYVGIILNFFFFTNFSFLCTKYAFKKIDFSLGLISVNKIMNCPLWKENSRASTASFGRFTYHPLKELQ